MIFNQHAYEIYKQAEEAFCLHDHQKAIELCLKSLESGEDSLVYNLLGQIYEKMGNIPTAIKYYEKAESGQKDLRYPRSLALKRAEIKREHANLFKKDLSSLIALEKIYCRQELQWHWAELRDFADNLRKQGDFQRALTWINAAINSRMLQMNKENSKTEYDTSLAPLYTLKGIIYMQVNAHFSALREFLIATVQYEWQPTKLLVSRIESALKKADIPEQVFSDTIEVTKTSGLMKGLSQLENYKN